MSRLLIRVSHLFKSFSHEKLLFDDVSIDIHEGECFAFIGENGSGKTTFLKALEGKILPDNGQVHVVKGLTICSVPQEIILCDNDITVRDFIENGPLKDLEILMDKCLKDGNLLEWEQWHAEYERQGGYSIPPLEKLLHGLNLTIPLDTTMRALSSGQKARAALAKALLANPDLLLLDEPTNHLDHTALEWLQITIKNRKGATIIVSHDRRFLNEACNRLIELEKGALTYFGGSYDYYLEEKERLLQKQIRDYEEQQEEKARLKQKIKALAYSKKKPRARSDQDIMAYDYRGGLYQESLQHHLNDLKMRLEKIEKNSLVHPKPKTITGLKFKGTILNMKVAIELRQISKCYGSKTLFQDFSNTIEKDDRIILIGENGTGKTTLLKCILGKVPLDAGQIYVSPSIKIAYLDQECEELCLDETPLSYFERVFGLSEEELRRHIHMAGLGEGVVITQSFKSLSIGQRKRFMILALILQKPNVLLLDEPTNHLDLKTLEALEKALLAFEGALLAISHDRTFIEKIGTKVWTFQ